MPVGSSENDNIEIRSWGKIPEFSFKPKNHIEIGQLTDGIDMEAGSRITGSRFSVLKSDIAGLHRALTQFMLDMHIKDHGYEELYVPYIVNTDSLIGTGQLPKFGEELFKLEGSENYFLSLCQYERSTFIEPGWESTDFMAAEHTYLAAGN